jgi:hypothetical protein
MKRRRCGLPHRVIKNEDVNIVCLNFLYPFISIGASASSDYRDAMCVNYGMADSPSNNNGREAQSPMKGIHGKERKIKREGGSIYSSAKQFATGDYQLPCGVYSGE